MKGTANTFCPRFFIFISSILITIIGIGVLILTTIPATRNSFDYFEAYSFSYYILAIIVSILLIIFGLIGIGSIFPRGPGKICMNAFMIFASILIIIFFILALFLALILMGALVDKAYLKDTMCTWMKSWNPAVCFRLINKADSTSTTCPSSCPSSSGSFRSILDCTSIRSSHLDSDNCQYSRFFELYTTIERTRECSGLCNGDQMNCFYFSNPSKQAKLASPNIDSCFYSILDYILPISISLLVISCVLIVLGIIILICSFLLCCTDESISDNRKVGMYPVTNSSVNPAMPFRYGNPPPQTGFNPTPLNISNYGNSNNSTFLQRSDIPYRY